MRKGSALAIQHARRYIAQDTVSSITVDTGSKSNINILVIRALHQKSFQELDWEIPKVSN